MLGPRLLALFGSVVLMLLLACASVAGLMLSLAARRKREIAIRAAMGASPFRVVRQLLIENVTIALIGGALSLGIASYGIRLSAVLLPQNMTRLQPVTLDLSALMYTLAVAISHRNCVWACAGVIDCTPGPAERTEAC